MSVRDVGDVVVRVRGGCVQVERCLSEMSGRSFWEVVLGGRSGRSFWEVVLDTHRIDGDLYWIDIHHSDASKGGAVEVLREMLGATNVISFGDSDNDLTMFAVSDETCAPFDACLQYPPPKRP